MLNDRLFLWLKKFLLIAFRHKGLQLKLSLSRQKHCKTKSTLD